jgi:2-(1,2-epoxy-1,2-dihydrophenyl)acetyl-CoA isomerase
VSHIRLEVDGGIAVITICRPEKRNAMTYAVLREFNEAVWAAADDDDVQAVIVTGAGGAFCAGTDLTELAETPDARRWDDARSDDPRNDRPWQLVACPKPVIAAIDGPAVGMGAEIASQCDVRIASDQARFGWVFVQRGLVPDMGAAGFLLPRIVGPTEALRLTLSGEIVDAAEALRIGFVSQVVAPDDLLDAARAEASRYLSASPFAVARTKALLYEAMGGERSAHLARNTEALKACFRSADHAEGLAAFLERRPARFTGR